jgi:hypothetical protein
VTPDCTTCNDKRWVCERHPSRPWGVLCCEGPRWARRARRLGLTHPLLPWSPGLPYWGPFLLAWRLRPLCEHGACWCGGAGLACPGCNPTGRVDWLNVIAEAS